MEEWKKKYISSVWNKQEPLFGILVEVAVFCFVLGTVVSILQGIHAICIVINVAGEVFSLLLFRYIRRTKRYQEGIFVFLMLVTVIMLPVTFFFSGGLESGTPFWFVVGLVTEFCMLEGRWFVIGISISLSIDTACMIVSWLCPRLVVPLGGRNMVYLDIVITFLVATFSLGCMTRLRLLSYEREKKINEKQQAELEAVIQARSSFFARMSHEIRTPINTIVGLNEMTLRENVSEEVNENARNIQAASRLLLALINDILDLSKIESGKMELVPERYDTREFLQELIRGSRVRANEKGLEFFANISEKLPSALFGDAVRLSQIVSNLLTNAVKYTKEGSITLDVSCKENIKNWVELKIQVTDTGIGIRQDDIGYLFDSFQRMDEHNTRGIEGTGLGLSIVKQLVELMEGQIMVDSIYQKGSTFTVLLKQKIVDVTPIGEFYLWNEKKEGNKDYKGRFTAPLARVLVTDDNEMNLLVVKKLLRATGVQADFAKSGKECLKYTMEKEYQLIFMDHMMPEMDGIETLHQIRSQKNGFCKETPVVALTANTMSGAVDFYIKSGFQDYLAKPISGRMLENMLLRQLPEEMIEFNEEQKDYEAIRLKEKRKKKKIRVTADNICDIPGELREKLDIHCISYYVDTGEGRFLDMEEIYPENIAEFIREGKNITSEAPTVREYEVFFGDMLERAEHIVHISAAGSMGRGCQHACEAARGFAHVTVIDSGQLSSGMGIMVLKAAKMAAEEMTSGQIAYEMERMKKNINTSFVLETPENLYRNGKISKKLFLFSGFFYSHPVFSVQKGKLSCRRMIFGDMHRYYRKYVREALKGKNINNGFLFLTYTGCTERQREAIRTEIGKYQKGVKIYEQPASAAISGNCGNGCFGLIYERKT